MSYVYVHAPDGGGFQVGFYKPNGEWEPDIVTPFRQTAADRVAWLNGSGNTRLKGPTHRRGPTETEPAPPSAEGGEVPGQKHGYITMPFGKHRGIPVKDVPEEYGYWLSQQDFVKEKFPAIDAIVQKLFSNCRPVRPVGPREFDDPPLDPDEDIPF